jgi:hypothetical protein
MGIFQQRYVKRHGFVTTDAVVHTESYLYLSQKISETMGPEAIRSFNISPRFADATRDCVGRRG